MLMKLLKYDMRSIGRSVWSILGALLILSALFGWSGNSNEIFLNTNSETSASSLTILLAILFVATFFASIGMLIYMIVQRFNQNLLGKQGYLMFSLPVSTLTHVFEKILLSLIWNFIWLLGITICFFILIFFRMRGISIGELMNQLMYAMAQRGFSISDLVRIFQEILVYTLMITTLTSVLYASIAVGHLSSSHRFITAVAAFIALTVIMSTVENTMNTFFSLESTSMGIIMGLTFWTAINGLLTWFILDKRLNLE